MKTLKEISEFCMPCDYFLDRKMCSRESQYERVELDRCRYGSIRDIDVNRTKDTITLGNITYKRTEEVEIRSLMEMIDELKLVTEDNINDIKAPKKRKYLSS